MLRIAGIKNDNEVRILNDINELDNNHFSWFWVDFCQPEENETELLHSYFKFHPLAIEDCIHALNRPKIDFYVDYNFLVLNSLELENFSANEVTLFVSDNYIVSFHNQKSKEVDDVWYLIKAGNKNIKKGPTYIVHQILYNIVDQYFPEIYKIEDQLNKIDNNEEGKSIHLLMDEVFSVRSNLIKLRRIVNAMRDLVYRIIDEGNLNGFVEHRIYFRDVYDHLLKQSEMTESCREITADMRDSYMSINSSNLNKKMMVLTVITTIFIPLTFIVGVYGMNFNFMPELGWKYGYFVCLGIMALIGVSMYIWFRKKGWFDI